jgi:dolichyl-phosphate-mannose--protein O-mannosyl transferase
MSAVTAVDTNRDLAGPAAPAEAPPGDEGSTGRAAGAARGRTPLHDRLSPPMPTDRRVALLVGSAVTVLAAVLRMVHLDRPVAFVFDELYYPIQAWSLLQRGTDVEAVDGFQQRVLAGDTAVLTDRAAFVLHPPFGKWLIALGESAFGLTPFGWRISVAVAGTLTVLLTFVVARRLTRSTVLAGLAGLLLAVDGLSVVTSRIALLDGFLTLWLLAGFGCLLRDRDASRLSYADAAAAGRPVRTRLWRPWRLAAGVCLGLACGVKWSGVWVLALLGVATVLWELGAYRSLGLRRPWRRALAVDGPTAFVSVVGTAAVAYVATWTGWFLHAGAWSARWHGGAGTWESFVYYHRYAYQLTTGITSPHTWASDPWGWLVQWRPVLAYRANVGHGAEACQASSCVRDMLMLGTPVLWWGGCVALVACLVLWVWRRDWRAGILPALVAAVWLPWFAYLDRTTFSFYVVAAAPYLVMALAVLAGYLMGTGRAGPERRLLGAVVVGAFVMVVLVQAAFLWPVWSGELVTIEQWRARMALRSWS